MIRDRKGSADGWYWGEICQGQPLDSYEPPFSVFNAGFGLYCTRCHASAESEHTFSALEQHQRPAGDSSPSSTTTPGSGTAAACSRSRRREAQLARPRREGSSPPTRIASTSACRMPCRPSHRAPHPADQQRLVEVLRTAPASRRTRIRCRGRTTTTSSPPHGKPQHFLTSDQCFGCHAGANSPGNVDAA